MAEGGLAVTAAIAGAAMQAAGTLVEVSPEQFIEIISRFREKGIIIVHGQKGMLTKNMFMSQVFMASYSMQNYFPVANKHRC